VASMVNARRTEPLAVQAVRWQGLEFGRIQVGDVDPCAGDQGDPAFPATLGIYRHTGHRERVDVPQYGPTRYFQSIGELGGGDAVARLKQQEEVEEPGRLHSEEVSQKSRQPLSCIRAVLGNRPRNHQRRSATVAAPNLFLIYVTDVDASATFYSSLFEIEPSFTSPRD